MFERVSMPKGERLLAAVSRFSDGDDARAADDTADAVPSRGIAAPRRLAVADGRTALAHGDNAVSASVAVSERQSARSLDAVEAP